MIKLTTKEDIALLIEEASEMFEETGCVPDVDGKKVRAEKRSSHVQSDTYWRQSTTPRQATMQRYGIRRGIRWVSRGCHKNG
jgi:hypothetical protein